MKINDTLYSEKKNFVAKLSETLNLAKPHLTCEYKLGEELGRREGFEFVVVTCENGYNYTINVTADSLACLAKEVFTEICGK